MDMPASPPRPAPAAVLVPVVGETAAARSRRRRWLQPQASLGLARLGEALLASSLLVWALLLALASDAAEAQQRGVQAPPQRAQRAPRGRHHPGHAEAHSDRDPGVPRRGCRALPSRFPTSSPPISSAPGLFQPLDRASFIDRVARPQRHRRAFRTGARSMPRRWWSAAPAGRRTAGSPPNFASGTSCPGASSPSQRFAVGRAEWRRLGHLVADQVYRAPHRRERLFRHPDRLHRRDRPQGPPQQAPRHHGPGRRQRASAEPGARAGAHAALQPDARRKSPSCNTPATSRACSC